MRILECIPGASRSELSTFVRRAGAAFAAIAFVGTASACGTFWRPTSEYLVQHASSPEQHQALSDRYRQEADRDRRLAASHQAMAALYAGGDHGSNVDAGTMAGHCGALATAYEKAAAEADALAQLHENAARVLVIDRSRRADGSLKQ